MQLKPCVKPFSKSWFLQIFVSTLIYLVFLLVGRWVQETFYIVSLMRFFNFVPAVVGFVFGLPGAIGAGLGNLIHDLIIGNIIYTDWYGNNSGIIAAAAIGNFMLAYLPYRLWYGVQGMKASRFIHNRRSFGLFVIIVTTVGFNFAVFLTSAIDLFSPKLDKEFIDFFILFVNNYVYPILMGIPIIYWLQKRKITFYYPPGDQHKSIRKHLMAFIFVTLSSAILAIAFYADVESDEIQYFYACLVFGLFFYVGAIPSRYVHQEEEDNNYVSLGSIVASKLLNLTTAVMLLFILMNIFEITFTDDNDKAGSIILWLDFYVKLMLALNCVFIAVYYLLAKFEKNVTDPLAFLSQRAALYRPNTGVSKELSALGQQSLENEIDVLEFTFSKMSREVQRYFRDLTAAKAEEHAMQAQLDVAMQIQQGALPNLQAVNQWLQEHGYAWRVAGGMEAARNVGGDMFDCFPFGDEGLFLSIGDVSGKGVSAALFAMMAQTLLSDDIHDIGGSAQLPELVARTNDALTEYNRETLFETLWAGIVNLKTGQLYYVNAGHNPPLIYDEATGTTTWVEEISGPVLGLMPKMTYTEHILQLPEHCRLLLYTDGFNEAENAHQEFFGNDRLEAAFAKAQTAEELLGEVRSFVNGAPPSDDKTYVWLERN